MLKYATALLSLRAAVDRYRPNTRLNLVVVSHWLLNLFKLATSQTTNLVAMPDMSKKRIVKDFEALPDELIARIKMEYPYGFAQHLLSYTNKDGNKVSALPFETEDVYYLIRMTVQEAHQIIEEDEDYDEGGTLREDFALEGIETEEEEPQEEVGQPNKGKSDEEDDDDDEDYWHKACADLLNGYKSCSKGALPAFPKTLYGNVISKQPIFSAFARYNQNAYFLPKH